MKHNNPLIYEKLKEQPPHILNMHPYLPKQEPSTTCLLKKYLVAFFGALRLQSDSHHWGALAVAQKGSVQKDVGGSTQMIHHP